MGASATSRSFLAKLVSVSLGWFTRWRAAVQACDEARILKPDGNHEPPLSRIGEPGLRPRVQLPVLGRAQLAALSLPWTSAESLQFPLHLYVLHRHWAGIQCLGQVSDEVEQVPPSLRK